MGGPSWSASPVRFLPRSVGALGTLVTSAGRAPTHPRFPPSRSAKSSFWAVGDPPCARADKEKLPGRGKKFRISDRLCEALAGDELGRPFDDAREDRRAPDRDARARGWPSGSSAAALRPAARRGGGRRSCRRPRRRAPSRASPPACRRRRSPGRSGVSCLRAVGQARRLDDPQAEVGQAAVQVGGVVGEAPDQLRALGADDPQRLRGPRRPRPGPRRR